MVNGMPDRGLFRTSGGDVLAKPRKAARSKAQGLMVFGEMVAVLWDKGAKDAALQREALWNDALHDRAFHLHCVYPRWGFINADDEVAGLRSPLPPGRGIVAPTVPPIAMIPAHLRSHFKS